MSRTCSPRRTFPARPCLRRSSTADPAARPGALGYPPQAKPRERNCAQRQLDGTDVLPLATGTGGKETGDIYAVRFGTSDADAGVTDLTNGGIQATDLGEAHDKPVHRTRIEFYCGIALFGGKAAARLTNVLAG
ncbi:hypothetical protein [Kitasatospora griseola]|uniref:hypothetical protein n=1 Tax=Kitasatospora griseola TaxID=2064 RepID=UPI0038021474